MPRAGNDMMLPSAQAKSGRMLRFSTLDVPEQDRFHYWTRDSLCACDWDAQDGESFDADAIGSNFGPFILSRRILRNPGMASYVMIRDERRIRMDEHDFFRFTVPLEGEVLFRTAVPASIQKAGELNVLDAAQVNESKVSARDTVSLVVPRDILPGSTAALHGHILAGGLGHLLRDHILSLFQHLPRLGDGEVASVAQATRQLLAAAVAPTPDAIRHARKPIRGAFTERVRRYVDAHLLDPDLTPDRICRDAGVSRAKLYQLFDDQGGIMAHIRRRRLRRAYHALAASGGPRPPIAGIAASHGFASEKHFYRLFKAEFGHTPGETPERAVAGHALRPGVVGSASAGSHVQSGWTLPFGSLSH